MNSKGIKVYLTRNKVYLKSYQDSKVISLEVDGNTPGLAALENISAIEGLQGVSFDALVGVAEPTVQSQSPPYLILVRRKSSVGEIQGSTIWRAESFGIIPLSLSDKESKEKEYLIQILSTPYFYFSYDYHLTLSNQTIQTKNISHDSLYSRADERFVWNESLLSRFHDFKTQVPSLFVPLVLGAIFIRTVIIKGNFLTYALLSRRSRHRVGTRFFVRGSDSAGNVANYVETEQIVVYENKISSFVQTRGSIPIYWQQTPDIRYKPPAIPYSKMDSGPATHLKDQVSRYGKNVLINLIDHKKSEGIMEVKFRKFIEELDDSNLFYVPFDFHSECKPSKGGWAQLSKLIHGLEEEISSIGYFDANKTQNGVFRTNCMDCLDRTNVVQSLLASEILQTVLTDYGILPQGSSIVDQADFQTIYKNIWADHANLISIQYSGTGALKTDFTRTGVRTKWGLLQDGWNSGIRYIKNNFSDGFRQNSYDYFQGNFGDPKQFVEALEYNLSKNQETSLLTYLIRKSIAVTLTVILFCVLFLSPQTTGNSFFLFILFCILFLLLLIVMDRGTAFVDYPLGYDPKKCPPLSHGVKKSFVY